VKLNPTTVYYNGKIRNPCGVNFTGLHVSFLILSYSLITHSEAEVLNHLSRLFGL